MADSYFTTSPHLAAAHVTKTLKDAAGAEQRGDLLIARVLRTHADLLEEGAANVLPNDASDRLAYVLMAKRLAGDLTTEITDQRLARKLRRLLAILEQIQEADGHDGGGELDLGATEVAPEYTY